MTTAPPASDEELTRLLGPLVDALLGASFEGTMRCEQIVRDIAAVYGRRVEVTFLADAAILTVGDRTLSFAREPGVPPLNRVTRFKHWVADVRRGDLTTADATARFAAIQAVPPRWSKPWRVLGLVAFAVGFGVSVQSTWQQVAVSAVTGLLVALLVVATDTRKRLTLAAPFLASVLVTVAVLVPFEHGLLDGGPIQLIVPALFYFIPGDAITAAALELAGNRMTAGAARLAYSLVVLLVLAFGALLATVLLGIPRSHLFDAPVPGTLGPAAVWAGWVMFAIGVMLTFSMDPADFPWALGLILLTAAVTELATRAAGDPVGTFFGAFVMMSAALLLGRHPTRPPPYVLYLGAFYVLTPGSHGLRGLETWIGGHPLQGLTGVADMVTLLIAVAVGMLVAAAAFTRSA